MSWSFIAGHSLKFQIYELQNCIQFEERWFFIVKKFNEFILEIED